MGQIHNCLRKTSLVRDMLRPTEVAPRWRSERDDPNVSGARYPVDLPHLHVPRRTTRLVLGLGRSDEVSAHAGHLGLPTPGHGEESGHGAAEACLALLTASLAGLAAVLALSRARTFATTIGVSSTTRSRPRYLRVDPLTPSLDALCLSRT